jgi:hypothetical protein
LFSAGKTKPTLTRREKREAAHRLRQNQVDPDPVADTAELEKDQKSDQTLEKAWSLAEITDTEYLVEDNLLYHRGQTSTGEELLQLVLPASQREKVLKIAHSTPLAGHLGRRKTTNRLLQRFFWPGISKDVAVHCQTCMQCQRTARVSRNKAPLMPLPVIEEPFKRIAMDIVGPVQKSSQGNRFILTVMDYATKFPEAIPLRRVDAVTVAEALVEVFSRLGIPEEILTDQGSNFMSTLMSELFEMLKVNHIRTSPYHPQTDGMVERFNGTIKAMLRKCCGNLKEWDKMIPYLLFAYREVPHATTGFSPFELLYGRNVRGPLDLLKEQ